MTSSQSSAPTGTTMLLAVSCIAVILWLVPYLLPSLAGLHFLLPQDGRLLIFPYPLATVCWAAAAVLISFAGGLLFYRRRSSGTLGLATRPWQIWLWPLILLPLSALPLLFRLRVDQAVVANIAFYLPVAVISLLLAVLWRRSGEPALHERRQVSISTRLILIAGLLFFLLYWLTGWYFTLAAGAHSGDEGHYLIQAESLYQDHDLDIYNNFDERERRLIDNDGQEGREHLHISPTSREGHYYSWHPFGLPLYLSLLPPHNLMLRHLLLGLLSGAGAAGLLLLCRTLGVGREAALPVVSLFCLSALWGIYSVRVLPEMPGAVLAIWTGIALTTVHRRPYLAGLLLILCCGYLPFLHQRFTPISLLGYLFFIHAAWQLGPSYRRWRIIVLPTAGLALLALVFFGVGAAMFTTGVGYAPSQFIFYPAGAWEVLTSSKSITAILPSFAWIFAAVIYHIFTDRTNRSYMLFALLSFFLVLLLSCTNKGWTGGASTLGRYLLAVAPLLLPAAASVFERTNRVARWWFIFLSLISVGYFLLVLARLPEFLGNFGDPRYYIGYVYGYMEGLLDPFPRADSGFMPWSRATFFILLLFVLTLMLIRRHKGSYAATIYPLVIIGAAVLSHHPAEPRFWNQLDARKAALQRKHTAADWLSYDLDRALYTAIDPEEQYRLSRAADLFSLYNERTLPVITTEKAPEAQGGRIVYQPDRDANDWQGRPFFWTTLGTRFSAAANPGAFSIDGRLSGMATLHLVVVELGGAQSRILLEHRLHNDGAAPAALSLHRILHPSGEGMVHILVRISEGEGTFVPTDLGWSPFSETLLDSAGAYVPRAFLDYGPQGNPGS